MVNLTTSEVMAAIQAVEVMPPLLLNKFKLAANDDQSHSPIEINQEEAELILDSLVAPPVADVDTNSLRQKLTQFVASAQS